MLSAHFTQSLLKGYDAVIGKQATNALLFQIGIDEHPEQLTVSQLSQFVQAAYEIQGSREITQEYNRRCGIAFAKFYNVFFDDIYDIPVLLKPLADTVVMNNEVFLEACPFCTNYRNEEICICSFVEGWLSVALYGQYHMKEVQCLAKGDEACVFYLENHAPGRSLLG